MQELIRITEQNGKQVVSARELHSFLGSKKDFSDWVKHRISKYGFIENQDFTRFHQKGEANNATLIEYALTIDAAKEMAMVEGNAKGKEARQYFIACENNLKTVLSVSTPDLNPAEMKLQVFRMLEAEAESLKEQLQLANNTIEQQAPAVMYAHNVLKSESCYTTTTIAKELGMGAKTLNLKLKALGIQYHHDGHWLLYAQFQNKGYTQTRTHTYYDSENKQQSSLQTVWTEKGRAFIHKKLNPSKAVA